MNGAGVGSGETHNALRVVLDPYDISARRCVKVDGHRAGRGVLCDRVRHTITVGVKHIAPAGEVEFAGEVARRDRLSDRNAVVPAWHCHRYPVEEDTGRDVVLNLPASDAVIQVKKGLGRAVREL